MAAKGSLVGLSDLGLACMLFLARMLTPVLSAVDAVIRPSRTMRIVASVRAAGGSPAEVIRQIWFGRTTRECLRIALQIGLSAAVLRRVIVTGNTAALTGPCVYAIYHTPWGRVMAHWLRGRSQTTLFATGRWESRARAAHLPCDRSGLRRLLTSLRGGACAAVTIDHFGSGPSTCDVRMLGRSVSVSTGAARIASAACVPVVLVIPRFRDGALELNIGAPVETVAASPERITRKLFEAFNSEMKRDLSGWEGSYAFLEHAVG